MANYENEHARLLSKFREKGAPPVVFTVWTSNPPVKVEGLAIEIPADAEEYKVYDLTVADAITLMFIPITFGEIPPLHSSVMWAGREHSVHTRLPIRPAGIAIATRVLLV